MLGYFRVDGDPAGTMASGTGQRLVFAGEHLFPELEISIYGKVGGATGFGDSFAKSNGQLATGTTQSAGVFQMRVPGTRAASESHRRELAASEWKFPATRLPHRPRSPHAICDGEEKVKRRKPDLRFRIGKLLFEHRIAPIFIVALIFCPA